MPLPTPELIEFFEQVIPFNRYLGMHVIENREGFVRMELPYRPELVGDPTRPALHGGVIASLVDAAGGFAVWTTLQLRDRLSTIDMRVDYLAPGLAETLLADAQVVRMGNRVAVVDVKCFQRSAPDKLVATGKAVYNVKRAEDV